MTKEFWEKMMADLDSMSQEKFDRRERCGYVHIWFLELTEDFKKNIVDYLKNMGYERAKEMEK